MPKGILGLEITQKAIRYAYLEKRAKDILLSAYGIFPFVPSLPEAKTPPVLSEAIKKIIIEKHLPVLKQCFTLSKEDAFIHSVVLPKMSAAELKEVIVTEIERIPALSQKAFDYIYSDFKLDEHRINVLFSASTKENLDFYIQAASQSGIDLESLEVSPLNLWEILANQVTKDSLEALIVLEDKFSYLMIFSPEQCKFFYTMPTGKKDLYPPKNERIDNAIFFSWAEEIRRLFKSYTREYRVKEIEKLWFIWDNQDALELPKLLKEELRIEVIPPDLGKLGIALTDEKAEFNPVYFLCLAAPFIYLKGLKRKFFFEHFLQEIKSKIATRKIFLNSSLFILLAALLLGGIALAFLGARKNVLRENAKISSHIANLKKQTADLEKETALYVDSRERLLAQATYVRMLNRVSWAEIFNKVQFVLPPDVSFSSLSVSEDGQVKIRGATLKIDSLAELIRNIDAAAGFEQVKFESLRETEAEGKRIVEFAIFTRLKREENAGN